MTSSEYELVAALAIVDRDDRAARPCRVAVLVERERAEQAVRRPSVANIFAITSLRDASEAAIASSMTWAAWAA